MLKRQLKMLIGVIDIETVVYNGKLYPFAVGVPDYPDNRGVELETFYIKAAGGTSSKLDSRSNDLILSVCSFLESTF